MALLNVERLFADFRCNPPADEASLRQLAAGSAVALPEDYLEFLRAANGGEGFVGPNSYLILWRAEELVEMNESYQVGEYAPGLFLFGSDGGGEAFAFDFRSDAKDIIAVPFVGMDLSAIRPLSQNFAGFLEKLFES
jgi:hypothetical protein